MRTTVIVALSLFALFTAGGPLLAQDLIYSFPLTTNPGWTMEGNWGYGPAIDPCWLIEGYTDTNIYGVALGSCYPDDMSEEGLTATALDCTGLSNVTLRFWRDLGVAEYDRAAVEVSNDGSTWTTVWENSGYNWDSDWVFCEYDISAVADGQPTVYIRWVMGPSIPDDWCYCYGWRIDDIEVWADTDDPPVQILAWIPYTDVTEEYPRTLAALESQFSHFVVTESWATDPAELSEELVDQRVFLAPEPENATSDDLQAVGEAFAPVLQGFAENGGTVIVCGESNEYQGLLSAAGLMSTEWAATYSSGEELPVVDPDHPIASGLDETVAAMDATNAYIIGEDDAAVVEDGSGNAVVAYRNKGHGAAIIIGYDYFSYDTDAAIILANSVQYPPGDWDILVYDTYTNQHAAQEAVTRLGLEYTVGGEADFNTLLASQAWEAVLVDCPSNTPAEGWAPLISFVGANGKAALSTYLLSVETDLAAAFGVASTGSLDAIPPIYRWYPGHVIFTFPQSVPDLPSWASLWGLQADQLLVLNPADTPLAGFTVTPTDGQAALVMANSGRTFVNGFLWDDHNQDADSDGTEDCVELIMNEAWFLLNHPEARFRAYPLYGAAPLEVAFVDESHNDPTSWSWDFGDGNSSTDEFPVHEYMDVGSYTVSLTVSSSYGEDTETRDNYIQTVGAAVADFSGTPTSGAAPLDVSFTDLSSGTPTAWLWDFGDSGTSTAQNPSHQYTGPGSYTVSLTASNIAGADTETKSDYITAAVAPVADFSGSPTGGAAPLDVSFTDLSTGAPTSWSWDFGDSGTSTAQNPSHQYTGGGSYTVSLTVSSIGGEDTETKSDYITAFVPPVADFSGAPTSGAAPLEVSFTDLSTNNPTSWSWDFGDSGTSTAQNPSHQYTGAGTFTVSLTVSNVAGEDTETKTDYITAFVAPVADFSGSPTSGAAPLDVSFTDLSGNSPTSWAWDFGDSGTSTAQYPSHQYTGAGSYTVSLTASNTAGEDTETKSSYITAFVAPVADFSGSPTSGAAPLEVSFTDLSTNDPTSWSWDFGDSGTSTAQNPSHQYTGAGSFTVSLTVSNIAGEDTETKSGYIQTGVTPAADFSADATHGPSPLDVSFTDLSTGTPTAWEWDFGDATGSAVQDPSHQYDMPGFYTVSLTAENVGGSDTETKDNYIAVGFPDTPADYWAFYQIVACYQAGVAQGYWDGYRPEETVNRAQMAVYMARALAGGDGNVPTGPATATFPDVPTDDWAYDHVEYCYANDIVQGYWDGYHPDGLVNRAQMSVYVARAVAGGDGNVPPGPGTATFADVPSDYWAYDYVEYCYDQGIVQGYWDGYRPEEVVNRAQMAVYVQRGFGYWIP